MAIKKIILANPRGFCAGVVRAIEIVEQAMELLPPPPPPMFFTRLFIIRMSSSVSAVVGLSS